MIPNRVAPPLSLGWLEKPPSWPRTISRQRLRLEPRGPASAAGRATGCGAAALSTIDSTKALFSALRSRSRSFWSTWAATANWSLRREPSEEPSQKVTTVEKATVSAPMAMLTIWKKVWFPSTGLPTIRTVTNRNRIAKKPTVTMVETRIGPQAEGPPALTRSIAELRAFFTSSSCAVSALISSSRRAVSAAATSLRVVASAAVRSRSRSAAISARRIWRVAWSWGFSARRWRAASGSEAPATSATARETAAAAEPPGSPARVRAIEGRTAVATAISGLAPTTPLTTTSATAPASPGRLTPSSFAVSGPTSPSGTRPCASWKAWTACAVASPKSPSIPLGSNPLALSARWMAFTASPPMLGRLRAKRTAGPGVGTRRPEAA